MPVFFFESLLPQQDIPQLAKELQPYIKRWFSDGASEESLPAMHLHPPRLVSFQVRILGRNSVNFRMQRIII